MLTVPVLNVLLLSPKFQCQGGLRDNSWRSSGPVFLTEARIQALLEEGTWGPLQAGRVTVTGSGCRVVLVGKQWGGEDIQWPLLQPCAQNARCLHDLHPWLALGTTFQDPANGKTARLASSRQRSPGSLASQLAHVSLLGPFACGRGVQLVTRMYYRLHTAKAGLWQQLCSSQSPKYLWKFCWSLFCFIGGNKNKK